MPARSIDTATIAFGLVAIPVKIYSTGEPSHELHFHLVHEGCGERLHQQYVCPVHGKVERDQMIKGYELTKGNFIELSRSELKALDAVASDDIEIKEFVPAQAIDPLFIEHSYYLGPGKSGERAYQLFRDALVDTDLVAIAVYSARGKQYIVELRPYETGLLMHQLRYPDEVKRWSEVPATKHVKASPAELGLARQVVESLRHETFDPSQYKDEVKERVRGLIARKAKGGEITAPPSAPRAPVTDLMAALKASLGAGAGPPAKHNGAPKPAAKHAVAAHPRRSTAGHTRSGRLQKPGPHPAPPSGRSRGSGARSAARPARAHR